MDDKLPQINTEIEIGDDESGVHIDAQVAPEGGEGTIDVDLPKSPHSISIKG